MRDGRRKIDLLPIGFVLLNFMKMKRTISTMDSLWINCRNVFRVRVKLGGARRWIRRCDSKLLTLIYTFRKRCRYSRGCNAIRPLTPFALMWIDWPLVNQSMINLNYSVLSGLNSYWSRHLVSIDETNLPSVQLVNEIETVFTTMKKEGNFFLFFFFFNLLN